jgi:hypothetical protein
MATATTIVADALLVIGNSNPTVADKDIGLRFLNNMLSSWSAEKILTHVNVRESFTLTSGTAEYTWGSGGDISTARPIALQDVFLRDSSGNDYPVEIITEDAYNDRSLKTTSGRVDRIYYATEYTLGKIFTYPTSNSSTDALHFSTWKALSEISAITDTVSLPNEYKEALVYNLAMRLAPLDGYTMGREDALVAERSLERIRSANSKDMISKFDSAITKYNTFNIDNLRFI